MEKNKEKVKQGKKSRKEGKEFEPRVYKDLSEKGWIVNRWNNDVIDNKLIPAKTKWRRTPRGMMPMNLNPGFPDFTAHQYWGYGEIRFHHIIGVECKINGKLDKLEKEKCQWYLDNNIFSKILIAEKTKEGRKIVIKYHDFKEYAKKKTA